jgi:hypothetical protein
MSEAGTFILQHQPKDRPYVRYEGSPMAAIHNGQLHCAIRTDRVFHGVKNCYESCEVFKATGRNGRHIPLAELVTEGDLNGKFDPLAGPGSRWNFDLKLNPSALLTPMERQKANADGRRSIISMVTLSFRHTATEFIPRACPPGVTRSPCDEALVEEKKFTYTSHVNASLYLNWRVVRTPPNN